MTSRSWNVCGSNDADKAYAKFIWVMAKLCDHFKLDPAKDITGHFFLDPARKTDPVTGLARSRRTYEQLLKDIVTEFNECTGIAPAQAEPALQQGNGTLRAAVKLNLRAAPDTRSGVIEVIAAGTQLSYVAMTDTGQAVNNNSTWYQDANGHWFWSGGTLPAE